MFESRFLNLFAMAILMLMSLQSKGVDADLKSINFKHPKNFMLKVDLNNQCVLVFHKNQIIKKMICSSGATKTPTPTGIFKTHKKEEYIFVKSHNVGIYYWTRFNGHISFHSVLYDQTNKLIKSEYEKLGRPASGGCIRLKIEDSQWLYNHLPIGVKVIVK